MRYKLVNRFINFLSCIIYNHQDFPTCQHHLCFSPSPSLVFDSLSSFPLPSLSLFHFFSFPYSVLYECVSFYLSLLPLFSPVLFYPVFIIYLPTHPQLTNCTLTPLIRNCLIHTQESTLRLLLSTSFSSTSAYLLSSHPSTHPPNLTHTLTLLIHHPAQFTLSHLPKSHQHLFFSLIHHHLSTFHPSLLIHHHPDYTPCHPHLTSTPHPHSAIRIKYPPIHNQLIHQHLIHTLSFALNIHPSINVSSTNTSSTAVSPTLELHYRAS